MFAHFSINKRKPVRGRSAYDRVFDELLSIIQAEIEQGRLPVLINQGLLVSIYIGFDQFFVEGSTSWQRCDLCITNMINQTRKTFL